MISFKQFITEGGTSSRKGNVLYASPAESLQRFALRFSDRLESIVSTLKLPERYGKQKLKVDAYVHQLSNVPYLQLGIPIPDGLDPDEADFFISMATKTVKHKLGEPHQHQCKDKNRNYFESSEFPGIIGRRNSPVTSGDTLILGVVPNESE